MSIFSNHLKRISSSNDLDGIQRVSAICIVAIAFASISILPTKNAYAKQRQTTIEQQVVQPQAGVVEQHAIVTLQDGTGHIERNHQTIELVEGVAVLATIRDSVVARTGTIEISYFDGQTSIIPPRSEIEIVFHDQIGDEQRVVLLQHTGRSINSVDKRTSNTSRFEVQTPSSIASLNVSQFAVELSSPQSSRYSSNTGEATVFVENQEPVEVEPGYEVVANEGETPIAAPMHNTRRTALFTKKVSNASCPDSGVQLKQPEQKLDGMDSIDFYGTATHKDFDYYKLEYTIVGRPANKYSWLHRGDEAVEDGLLASVNVTDLAAGEYVIRLQVVDKSGNYPDSCSINLEIK